MKSGRKKTLTMTMVLVGVFCICLRLEWEQTLNIFKFSKLYSIKDIKFANTYLFNELSSTESKDGKKRYL